jgi:hypothetical protein
MPWDILAGTVEWWADERRRDVGRERFHRTRGTAASSDVASPGTIDCTRAAFVAQRHPWRLSELTLDTSNDDVAPAVTSWAGEATAVLKGAPARQHLVGPQESWGDLGVRLLLIPAAIEALIPKPWAREFQIPGEVLERDVSVLPELLSLGTGRYEVSYDGDLDIVTSWTAVIDDAAVQWVRLGQVASLAR